VTFSFLNLCPFKKFDFTLDCGVKVTCSPISSVQRVPLDEYYYGSQEGDANFTEEKGEFRFKVGIFHSHCYTKGFE